ncbi:hypothetical protein NQ314_007632 [Rhamnusium bicolor]|uniref:Uncharacterized protein n=1 Tax=Rhamnusium bicolor TaxID=1586634 RepID=A0AAV8YN47_9CUCU|nr:hypothetical protein NQ314_007632 [Rhamnusium bicolor]
MPHNCPETRPKELKRDGEFQKQQKSHTVTPESIRSYPKAAPRKTNRKHRNKGRSTIITDTPEKTAIEEKAAKAEQKKLSKTTKKLQKELGTSNGKKVSFVKGATKKIDKVYQNDWTSDYNSGDDHCIINDTSSDDDGWIPQDEDELQVDYEKIGRKNDFALIKFPNKVFYIGKLLSDMDEEGEYQISYMRKSEKLGGCFVFPNVADEHSVNSRDIEFILPEPSSIKSKRLSSGLVKFPISLSTYNVR